jgi:hypothetical protein
MTAASNEAASQSKENWEENEDNHADNNNLRNYMEARFAAAANGDQVSACRWGNDWNKAEEEELAKMGACSYNEHISRRSRGL